MGYLLYSTVFLLLGIATGKLLLTSHHQLSLTPRQSPSLPVLVGNTTSTYPPFSRPLTSTPASRLLFNLTWKTGFPLRLLILAGTSHLEIVEPG